MLSGMDPLSHDFRKDEGNSSITEDEIELMLKENLEKALSPV